MSLCRRWFKSSSQGQGLVEFALVLPVCLVILVALPVGVLYVLALHDAADWADQAAQLGADAAAIQGDNVACPLAMNFAETKIAELAIAPTQVQVTCQVQDTADPANRNSYGQEGTRQVSVTVKFHTLANLPASVTGTARINRGVGP
jgi:Flp pilus assembly protein TadG